MFRAILLGLVVALGSALVSGAGAEPLRYPKSGVPAFTLDLPAGWTVSTDQFGNLQVARVDKSSMLQLNMIADEAVGKATLPDIAAAILKGGGLPPYTRSETDSIAGLAGQGFITEMKYPNGTLVDFRIVLVKLDSSHVASTGRVTRRDLTFEQAAALAELMGRIRIVK